MIARNISTGELFWGSFWHARLYGVILGAGFGGLYGAAFGTLIFPLIGTAIGFFFGILQGVIVGLPLGALGGLLLFALATISYRNAERLNRAVIIGQQGSRAQREVSSR